MGEGNALEQPLANEITVPLLPCRDIDEIVEFYGILGFRQTYYQALPNPYVALKREDINLHFATQFAEFADRIAQSMTVGDEVRVPDALIQPIPADEVASAVAGAATAEPINGIVNIGGPQKITFEEMARDAMARQADETKTVVVDPEAPYFGAALTTGSLVTPG